MSDVELGEMREIIWRARAGTSSIHQRAAAHVPQRHAGPADIKVWAGYGTRWFKAIGVVLDQTVSAPRTSARLLGCMLAKDGYLFLAPSTAGNTV